MDIGYARVSTAQQDLARQLDALQGHGIDPKHIYIDKKSGATTKREGLQKALDFAREGDVIVVYTLDRLGRTVRDTLNMIHDLQERGIGVRTLADPIKVDSTNRDDPMAQLGVVLLAMFAQMERTYTMERAAHARAVALKEGRQIGRPSVLDEKKLRDAKALREKGVALADIARHLGVSRATLYRHLPPLPPESVTVD
jgi:DNA invertase Pin-like site-specific DNA recombinase